MLAFDLGGTLIEYEGVALNWSEHYGPALQQAAEATGRALDVGTLARLRDQLALYNTRLHPREREVAAVAIFAEGLACAPEDSRLAPFVSAFFAYFQRRARPLPGAMALLGRLRQAGVPIAVLTDVPYGMPRDLVLQDLTSAGLAQGVDHLVTSVDVGWRKPRCEAFQALATVLGIPPSALEYVGDEAKDMEGVRSVGGRGYLLDPKCLRPRWGQTLTLAALDDVPGVS